MRVRFFLLCLLASLLAAAPGGAFTWLDAPGDTTPPVITVPSPGPTAEATSSAGATVNYAEPTATDEDPPSPTVSCDHHSGEAFPLGDTTVSCTAADTAGNPAAAQFTVTVVDTTPPAMADPPPVAATTTNAAGKTVSWSDVTGTDIVDGTVTATCSPSSGSNFSVGTTSVSCTATDAHGNSATKGFNVTLTFDDITKPTFTSVPGTINAEAAVPGGATVTYSVSATDDSGAPPTVVCNPGSGSTFPVGTTTVHCTATDAKGNSENAQFDVVVTLVDHTAPVLSGVPANKNVEANGPAGSIVNYSTPVANDNLDGLIAAVTCSPDSGSLFPLGTTAVNCSATDSHGNTGQASFNVTVADTTPPNLVVPDARSVYATTPTGIPNTVSGVVSFLSSPSATDIVDPSPVITNSATAFLPVGNLTITFEARDFSGNTTDKDVTLIVLPQPPPGTPPLPIPPPPAIPAQPTNVKVTPLDGAARIQWNAGGREVVVTRSSSTTRSLSAIGDERVVYTGTASRYTDRGLTNGVEYRYVVSAVDAAGNHSAGVAAVIVPRRNLLKSPKDGAKLRKAPKLVWALDSEAQYYNAQLLLNGQKILSVWPVRPAYVLKKSWKYEGRKYTLKPGIYTWFVWPGYGARSAVDYGELMGSRTFRIVR